MAEAPNASSNVAVINKAIDDAILAIIVEEERAKAMIAEHVQPHRDEVKAIKLRLKEQHEIDFANIKGRYYDLKRERQVKAFEDEEERNRALDQMRMGFEATAKGQNLDWLYALGIDNPKGGGRPQREAVFKGPAAPEAPAAEAPKVGPAENMDLSTEDPLTSSLLMGKRSLGEAAHNKGHTLDRNPHRDSGTADEKAWDAGWHTGEGVKARREGKAVTACPHTVGGLPWKAWNAGWNREAKRDGADAESVMRGGAGDDLEDIPGHLDRRPGSSKKATTAQPGNA